MSILSNIESNSSLDFQLTNSTHIGGTYVENQFASFFGLTLFQTFLVIFLSELGDKTFILIMVLKIKSTNPKLVFFASVISMFFINSLSILVGYCMDLFLYQNFIDIVAIAIFGLIGINLIISSFELEKTSFEEEVIDCIEGEMKVDKIKKQMTRNRSILHKQIHIINSARSDNDLKEPLISKSQSCKQLITLENELLSNNNNNDSIMKKDYKDDYFLPEDQLTEEEINKNFFWIFIKTIFITEFGDRTQFGMIAISSIYNFLGVLIGSFLALGLIIYIACFHGDKIAKLVSEKNMSIINGFVFLSIGMEIVYSNKYLNII